MYKLRGVLDKDKESNKPIDIKEYKITSKGIDFIDTLDNKYKLDDFWYFIVPKEELKTLFTVKTEE